MGWFYLEKCRNNNEGSRNNDILESRNGMYAQGAITGTAVKKA
jgi:hypothetical protein